MKVLFLAANPRLTAHIDLQHEARDVETEIGQTRFRDQLELVSEWAVRVRDLQPMLLRHRPDVVHFSGHGSPTEEIILEDDSGNPQPVSAQALSDLFRILRGNVRLVVLNACFAASQASAITNSIDCAIGMKNAIGDKAAIKFAGSLYCAIGYGRSVRDAFELGRNRLLLENIKGADIPQLFEAKGIDAGTICLCGPRVPQSPGDTSRSTVTLRFDLAPNDYSDSVRTYLVLALETFLNIPQGEARIVEVAQGSVIITVELPEPAAGTLRKACQSQDLELIARLKPLRLLPMPRAPLSLPVAADRSRQWLLGDAPLWASFVTVLAFGKRIHTIFQELDASHTQALVDGLSNLLTSPRSINQQQLHQRAWFAYSNRFDRLMDELRRDFPDNFGAVEDSYRTLQNGSGGNRSQRVDECLQSFQEIRRTISDFAGIHKAVHATTADPRSLLAILARPKTEAATELLADSMRLSATAKILAVNADNMIKRLIDLVIN